MAFCAKMIPRSPMTAFPLGKLARPLLAIPAANPLNLNTTNSTSALLQSPLVAKGAAMGPHALQFKLERYFAAGMIPLLPAAYFIHNPTMDLLLSFAIVMHSHWGMMAVVQDYARPIVIGEALAKLAPGLVYVFTVVLLFGLYSFNTHDVGLTKAFSMFFSL